MPPARPGPSSSSAQRGDLADAVLGRGPWLPAGRYPACSSVGSWPPLAVAAPAWSTQPGGQAAGPGCLALSQGLLHDLPCPDTNSRITLPLGRSHASFTDGPRDTAVGLQMTADSWPCHLREGSGTGVLVFLPQAPITTTDLRPEKAGWWQVPRPHLVPQHHLPSSCNFQILEGR